MFSPKKLLMTGGQLIKPQDVFTTLTYTGGVSIPRTFVTGLNLRDKQGLLLTKTYIDRAATGDVGKNWRYVDTKRGPTKSLATPNTQAEEDTGTDGVTSFNVDGFTAGNSFAYNRDGNDYVSWTFLKARRFFDVVTWTGNGQTGRKIPHDLGVAPGMMIVKCTTSPGEGWGVTHRGMGWNNYMSLQQAFSAGASGLPEEPSATEFTVPSNGAYNGNGQRYVAYLFAHDDSSVGIIKCGSYTGTAPSSAVVGLNWRPQFTLIKRWDADGDWHVDDVKFAADATLRPNSAESRTTNRRIDFTSTGLSINETGSDLNAAGGKYIFLAIRAPIT